MAIRAARGRYMGRGGEQGQDGRGPLVRLLGPVDAIDPTGGPVALGGPKERAVLAVLAISANRPVSAPAIEDALWGEHAPRTAAKTVQAYVSRLRRAGLVIESEQASYRLVLAPEQLDVDVVEALLNDARRALGDDDAETASDLLRRAEGMFRGPPFGELAEEPFLMAEAARLAALGVVVTEERVAADLARGRHDDLVGELASLTAAYPLRERLWAARMLALYRAGRQAEALRVFQQVRTHLAEELGIEPGPELRAMEAAVLAQAPELDLPVAPPRALPSGVVTFLLTDIEGSSALWEADAVAMAAALQRHDSLIAEVIWRRGGVLVKSKGEGDATLSVFPRASEAVAAALQLQEAIGSEEWPGDLVLRIRVAVHTGEAFERDGDYFGPAVNRAARLRALAVGGQTLLSGATAELVRDTLPSRSTLVDLGRHALRGLSRDEQVFEIRVGSADEVAYEPRVEADDHDVVVPLPGPLARGDVFVGRQEELDHLLGAWSEAAAGKRRAVFVGGEPGIGKTRLAAELARAVQRQDGLVLYGRCDEDLGAPYQSFAEALRGYVTAAPAAVLASQAGHGAAQLARLVPELAIRLPELPPASRADPESERFLLFEAVGSFLAAICSTRPATLVLDDLHWASKPTLLLLRHLVRRGDSMRLLIVGTYRDTELDRTHPLADALADFRRDNEVRRIPLGGLDDDRVLDLLEAVAGHELDERAPALAQSLCAGTGGNPFFVFEVLRHLADVGTIYQDDGRWTSSADTIDELGLPEGVREVISRRLVRLSDSCNRVLAVGAVIGHTFSFRVLERIADLGVTGDALLDAIEEAVEAQVLEESAENVGEYRFAHALIRHTLLGELSSTRRVRLHRRIGEAIEAVSPDADLGALAHHFTEAAIDGQAEKALSYVRKAAARALERLAYEQAVSLLERGLQVLELGEPPDQEARAGVLVELADALWRSGETARARAAAEEAAKHARAIGSVETLAVSAVVHTTASTWGTPDPVSAGLCEDALDAVQDDRPALRARVLAGLAYYRASGENQASAATRLAEEAVDLARRSGDDEALADSLYARVIALLGSPDVDARVAVGEELLALGSRCSNAEWRARGLRIRGPALLELGDRGGFERDLAELARLGNRLNARLWQANSCEFEGLLALLDGRFDEVEGFATKVVQHAGQDPNFANVYAGQLVLLGRERGESAEMLPLVSAVAEQNPGLLTYQAVLAHLHADVGELDDARVLFEKLAADDFEDLPYDIARPTSLCVLAEVAAALGDAPRAELLYSHLLPYTRQLMVVGWGIACLGSADRFLGALAATAGRFDVADQHFVAARVLEQKVGGRAALTHTATWHARALLRRDADGDRARARELLDEAAAAAEELGMAGVTKEVAQLSDR